MRNSDFLDGAFLFAILITFVATLATALLALKELFFAAQWAGTAAFIFFILLLVIFGEEIHAFGRDED